MNFKTLEVLDGLNESRADKEEGLKFFLGDRYDKKVLLLMEKVEDMAREKDPDFEGTENFTDTFYMYLLFEEIYDELVEMLRKEEEANANNNREER